MHNNPYTKATDAYGATATATDQRSLEGTVLLKSATRLESIAKRIEQGEKVSLEEIDDTLTANRKIWELFLDNMMDENNQMPTELKNNVASLAVFVIKRTQEVLIDTVPAKFQSLININRNIASGLMKKPPAGNEVPASTPPSSHSDNIA